MDRRGASCFDRRSPTRSGLVTSADSAATCRRTVLDWGGPISAPRRARSDAPYLVLAPSCDRVWTETVQTTAVHFPLVGPPAPPPSSRMVAAAGKVTPQDIVALKQRGERIAALTAYDYPMTRLLDDCGVPLLLVGDSLGMMVLGEPNRAFWCMSKIRRRRSRSLRGGCSCISRDYTRSTPFPCIQW